MMFHYIDVVTGCLGAPVPSPGDIIIRGYIFIYSRFQKIEQLAGCTYIHTYMHTYISCKCEWCRVQRARKLMVCENTFPSNCVSVGGEDSEMAFAEDWGMFCTEKTDVDMPVAL